MKGGANDWPDLSVLSCLVTSTHHLSAACQGSRVLNSDRGGLVVRGRGGGGEVENKGPVRAAFLSTLSRHWKSLKSQKT